MVPLQEIHATNGHDLFKFYQDFVHTGLWTHFIIFCPNSQEENCSILCEYRSKQDETDPSGMKQKEKTPIAARSPLLCPALRRNRTKQRSAAIKRRERLPFDRGAAALQALRLLKLKCSLPQCDSFFKGPFSISGAQKADFMLKNPAFCVQTIQKRMHSGRTASQAPLA